ncbi:uncharacterized protein EKO05_0004868 [Ascochyta rabiei]|uniref:Uncharacterized protein n=1 Tax=Didymella rabiei TaxID=5454 RepID=A0A163M4R2_DIDRA|nr:uncharacterized protein EKO05_0004868 [Ascochyta rabiei]KZM28401.1 hypothetical protein ST47_g440 [Ascochyta rabiei]UPX14383.1 hypothetical protein EKO05_0004868 [Ascochyta rabiei]
MAQSNIGAAAPFGLRIVTKITGSVLTVALPLPASMSGLQVNLSPKPLSAAAAALPTYDRAFWKRYSNSPIYLKIGTIIRRLGLKQTNLGPHPGRPVFDYDNVTQLAKAVIEVSAQLPTVLGELLDAATATGYASLHKHIEELLRHFGDKVWGAKQERTWLLQASDGEAEYSKDLVFESGTDRDILAHHLRLWILAKAFNTFRNKGRAVGPVSQISKDSQRNRSSTGQIGGSSFAVLHTRGSSQIPQARTRGNALAAVANSPAVSSDKKNRVPIINCNNIHLQVRRTARIPKHESGSVGYSSDSADGVPRHYNGKGRTWKKTEVDEDPLFGGAGKHRTNISTLRTTYGLRDGSKKRKSEKILSEDTLPGERSDEEITVWNNEREKRPERLRKNALSAPAHTFVQAQERIRDSLQQEEPDSKRKRRPARKYISEEIVRNSSDKSEEDNILTHIGAEWVVGTEKRNPFPRFREHHHSGEHNLLAAELYIESQPSLSTLGPPAGSASAMPLARRPLPLNEYWDKHTWRFYHLRGNERQIFLQTMRSLGLKVVSLHRVHLSYDKRTFVTLDDDVTMIAEKLSSQFSANQLIQFAADSNYLNEQIDVLLQTHSPMWSLDADRSQLLVPGVEEEYPKYLFYEESEGQKLIWIHLHRWVFLMALRDCRQMWGQKVGDMDKVPQQKNTEVPKEMLREYQSEGRYTVGGPEESSSSPSGSADSASSIEHGTVADRALTDCERNLLEAMGEFFKNEKILRDQNAIGGRLFAAEPAPAIEEVSRRRRRLVANSFTDTAQQTYSQASTRHKKVHHTTIDMSDGSALSTLFMSYIELYSDPEFDELAALKNLAAKLSVLERYSTRFHTRKGVDFATAFFVVAFPAWLMYRSGIVKAKRSLAVMQSPEQTPHHHIAVMERSRLATELRQAHETFIRAGHDGFRPEQVIYRAFITLQNEHANSLTAENIRRGFKGMEDELKSLGDGLMNEGGKWIVGDFASVSNLRGLQPHTRVGVGLYHRY